MRSHQWRDELISRALTHNYLNLLVSQISMRERLIAQSSPDEPEKTRCNVDLELSVTEGDPDQRSTHMSAQALNKLKLSGEGVGLIDASFEALVRRFESEYPSLRSIKFTKFEVRGELEEVTRAGSDALCRARLVIENSEHVPFEFEASAPSMASVSIDAVVQALEHFINAERAFTQIYHALEDAKRRGRHDLISSYTSQLSELVKTTSYTETIAQLRAQINI